MKWDALKPPCLYLEIASGVELHVESKFTNVLKLRDVELPRAATSGVEWKCCRRPFATFSVDFRLRVFVHVDFNAAPTQRTISNFEV